MVEVIGLFSSTVIENPEGLPGCFQLGGSFTSMTVTSMLRRAVPPFPSSIDACTATVGFVVHETRSKSMPSPTSSNLLDVPVVTCILNLSPRRLVAIPAPELSDIVGSIF